MYATTLGTQPCPIPPTLQAINTGDLSAIPDAVTDDFIDHGSPVQLPPDPSDIPRSSDSSPASSTSSTRSRICSAPRTGSWSAPSRAAGPSPPCTEAAAGKPYAMDSVHIYRTEVTAGRALAFVTSSAC